MNPEDILKSEGFVHVYKWHDEPGVEYTKHQHKDKVAMYVTAGDVRFRFQDGTEQLVTVGQRFDVPVGLKHTAKVGLKGCDYVVGEMIKGDS
jgi:uncharacterized RmlC-like cupin family protein